MLATYSKPRKRRSGRTKKATTTHVVMNRRTGKDLAACFAQPNLLSENTTRHMSMTEAPDQRKNHAVR